MAHFRAFIECAPHGMDLNTWQRFSSLKQGYQLSDLMRPSWFYSAECDIVVRGRSHLPQLILNYPQWIWLMWIVSPHFLPAALFIKWLMIYLTNWKKNCIWWVDCIRFVHVGELNNDAYVLYKKAVDADIRFPLLPPSVSLRRPWWQHLACQSTCHTRHDLRGNVISPIAHL